MPTSKIAPIPLHTSSLPGPEDICRLVLSNGITLLCRSNFQSPSVQVIGYLQCGSLWEPDEKLGLVDFTASALMRGTQSRGMQQIYDQLESCGASLSFGAATHSTGFSTRSLVEDLPLVVGLLAETLTQPAFPSDQVEKLRAQLLTGLALRAQDTADMAALTFDQILFTGHPYSRPDDGWTETIQAIQRDDLVACHQQIFGPRGMVIAVTGAIEAQNAFDLIEAELGGWHNLQQPDMPVLPTLNLMKKTIKRRIKIPGKSQADLVIGTNGPTRRDPEYLRASLGNSILGQFGMMGRIGEVVRERSGLAYSAYSTLNSGIGPGSWEVSAGVNPANVAKATRLIQQEIIRFVQEGVSREELSDSQANFIGRLPLSMESNGGVASALLTIERHELGLDYFQRYPDLVNAVTCEQVQETARHYLRPEALAIAVAGP